MRKMLSWVIVGLMSCVPFASAAEPAGMGQNELKCYFKDRGWNQHKDLRCRVRVNLCPVVRSEERQCVENQYTNFRVECSNHFELESESYNYGTDLDSLWFNADDGHKLATIRIQGLDAISIEKRNGEKYEADLLIANRITRHLEGKCWFEGLPE